MKSLKTLFVFVVLVFGCVYVSNGISVSSSSGTPSNPYKSQDLPESQYSYSLYVSAFADGIGDEASAYASCDAASVNVDVSDGESDSKPAIGDGTLSYLYVECSTSNGFTSANASASAY